MSYQSYACASVECAGSTEGTPVTRCADSESVISQLDADKKAAAAARTTAYGALDCAPVSPPGPTVYLSAGPLNGNLVCPTCAGNVSTPVTVPAGAFFSYVSQAVADAAAAAELARRTNASLCPPLYYNTEQSGIAYCPAGSEGAPAGVTVPAGQYCSQASQADANAQAKAAAIAEAISDLSCTYYNTQQTATVTCAEYPQPGGGPDPTPVATGSGSRSNGNGTWTGSITLTPVATTPTTVEYAVTGSGTWNGGNVPVGAWITGPSAYDSKTNANQNVVLTRGVQYTLRPFWREGGTFINMYINDWTGASLTVVFTPPVQGNGKAKGPSSSATIEAATYSSPVSVAAANALALAAATAAAIAGLTCYVYGNTQQGSGTPDCETARGPGWSGPPGDEVFTPADTYFSDASQAAANSAAQAAALALYASRLTCEFSTPP